jgi:hypothetical protein
MGEGPANRGGQSDVRAEGDRRFTDSAWTTDPAFRN